MMPVASPHSVPAPPPPPPPPRVRKRVPRLLRFLGYASLVGGLAVVLYAVSHPGGNVLAGTIGLGMLAVGVLLWLIIAVMAVVRRRFVVFLVLGPLVLAGGWTLAMSSLPERAAMTAAQPTLELAARTGICPPIVGWLRVSRCWSDSTGFYVAVQGAGFLSENGYARLVKPPAKATGFKNPAGQLLTVRPIASGWAVFSATSD